MASSKDTLRRGRGRVLVLPSAPLSLLLMLPLLLSLSKRVESFVEGKVDRPAAAVFFLINFFTVCCRARSFHGRETHRVRRRQPWRGGRGVYRQFETRKNNIRVCGRGSMSNMRSMLH